MNKQGHIPALQEEYKNTKRLLYAKLFKVPSQFSSFPEITMKRLW